MEEACGIGFGNMSGGVGQAESVQAWGERLILSALFPPRAKPR